MDSIFLYGSLLDSALRDAVFGESLRNIAIERATAYGFAALRYPGEAFPVLLPQVGKLAKGLILRSPNDEALHRMAFYEGDEYEMALLPVMLENGEVVQANYNRAKEMEDLVFEEPWCLDTWRATESHTLVRIAREYMARCWGIMSVIDADKVWKELQYLRNEPHAKLG